MNMLNLSRYADIRKYRVRTLVGVEPSPYGIYKCIYQNPTGNKIYIQFGLNEYPTGSAVSIDITSVPDAGDFSLSGIASSPTITNVTIVSQESYSELQITLSSDITVSDNGLISYTKGTNVLKDLSGLEINEWTDEPILSETNYYPVQFTIDYTDTQFEFTFKLPSNRTVLLDWGDGNTTEIVGNDSTLISTSSFYSTPGTYSFVVSESAQDITYIDLFNEPISGGDIGNWYRMPNLTYVHVGQTGVSGDLSTWTSFNALESIQVFSTNVTGDISSWAALSGSLTTIGAYNTSLSGSISSWSSLTNLSYLHIQNCNSIGGDISSWSSLTNMSNLWLYGTLCYGDISSWNSLTNMSQCYLQNLSNITGDVSNLASWSSSAYTLDLSATGLTGSISSLASYEGIYTFRIQNTSVIGDVSGYNSWSGSIRYINLSSTGISGDVSSWSSLTDIRDLQISNTSASGNVSDWSSMTLCTNMYLNYTDVTGDISGWSSMTNMNIFWIHYTSCSGDISNFGLWNNPSLIYVQETDVSGDISAWATASWTSISQIAAVNSNVTGEMSEFAAFSSSLSVLQLYNTSMSFNNIKSWTSTNDVLNLFSNDWSSTEVDNCLISLYSGSTTQSDIDVAGNNASRTAVSDTAYNWLLANNDTLSVN